MGKKCTLGVLLEFVVVLRRVRLSGVQDKIAQIALLVVRVMVSRADA